MKRKGEVARSLDWEQVRHRLERMASGDAAGQTAERERAILEERARLLARVPPEAFQAGEVIEMVTFRVAGERYGLASHLVREVMRLVVPTPLPGGPDYLAGVINLRGEIIAVFDPCLLFGLSRKAEENPTRILILGEKRIELGLLADAVEEVVWLSRAAILPSSDSLAGREQDLVLGVTADALILLDGSRLLEDRRLVIDGSEDAPSFRPGDSQ